MNPSVALSALLGGTLLGGSTFGAATLDAAGSASDSAPGAWPDNFLSRVEALALLQTLNAELLSHDSATQTLQQWCAAHQLAAAPRIVAEPVRAAPRPPSDEQRATLRVTLSDEVRYRHVRLRCGSVVLSEAENWYVPGRLTAEMNRQLETTDAPFGAVVRELQFQRHTLSARLLWSPLPPGWEMSAAGAAAAAAADATAVAVANQGSGQRPKTLRVPAAVLEHHAVLTLPDGTPFSLLVESYTDDVLAFPPPPTG